MKRLINKVAWHDVKFRDRAILYIDGEFVEANTHNIALTNWTYDNNIRRNSGQSGVARGNLVNEMANNRQLRDMPYACLHKLEIDPQTNEKRKMIFIDPETIYGIDLNELANLTKQKYPDYEIFEDSEQFTPEETDKYTKLAGGIYMKRLIKKSNHVGPLSHEDVEKDVIDIKRTKIRDGQDDFLMAKQLVCDSVLTPTNENFLFVRQMINEGKFSDLGKFNDDYENWITRCQDLAKEKGILRN